MDLGNLVEIVMCYFLIGEMVCLDRQDEFPMVSALVCTVTHKIRPTMNHDARLSIIMIHQITIPYRLSILRGY